MHRRRGGPRAGLAGPRERGSFRRGSVNAGLALTPHSMAVSEAPPDAGAAPSGRILELDGLRGCACLLVVLGHYFGEVEHGLRGLRLEWIGVDLFFCLSGFLIGGILLDNRSSPSYFAAFYIRRGFRIFPVYYLTVTLLLLALPGFAGLVEPAALPGLYYGYLQNFLMSFSGVEAPQWLTPTWWRRGTVLPAAAADSAADAAALAVARVAVPRRQRQPFPSCAGVDVGQQASALHAAADRMGFAVRRCARRLRAANPGAVAPAASRRPPRAEGSYLRWAGRGAAARDRRQSRRDAQL